MTTPATPEQGALPGAALPDEAPVTDVTDGTPIPPGPAGKPVPVSHADPTVTAGPMVTVAEYHDYASAQGAVDFLSDNGFPVERTAIVGTGLRLVENVLGRMTVGRAALAGAGSGAWFGLFIGFLFTLFSSSHWWAVLFTAIIIGAVWGAVFGAGAQAMTGGRRDFSSRSSLQATTYAVNVESEVAEEARVLVTRFTWRASNAQ
jgi:hypothetical protein